MASGSTGGGVGTYASMLSRHASPTPREATHARVLELGQPLDPVRPARGVIHAGARRRRLGVVHRASLEHGRAQQARGERHHGSQRLAATKPGRGEDRRCRRRCRRRLSDVASVIKARARADGGHPASRHARIRNTRSYPPPRDGCVDPRRGCARHGCGPQSIVERQKSFFRDTRSTTRCEGVEETNWDVLRAERPTRSFTTTP